VVHQQVLINPHSHILWSLKLVLVRAFLAQEGGATAPSSSLPMMGLESLVMGSALDVHQGAQITMLNRKDQIIHNHKLQVLNRTTLAIKVVPQTQGYHKPQLKITLYMECKATKG
jgi:hypothetical protein